LNFVEGGATWILCRIGERGSRKSYSIRGEREQGRRKGKNVTNEERIVQLEESVAQLERELKTKIVKVEKFVLLDNEGKVRGELHVDKDGPKLALLDEVGKLRIEVGVDKNVPYIRLNDGKKQMRVGIAVDEYGPGVRVLYENGKLGATFGVAVTSKEGEGESREEPQPYLDLYDENGLLRAQLDIENGEAALRLVDAEGNNRVQASIKDGEPVLWLRDAKRTNRVQLSTEEGEPVLMLFDKTGGIRARLVADEDGPSLCFFNELGEVVWDAPHRFF